MKKFFIFLAVAALVSAMSCTKEVNSDTVVEKETISVRLSPETKTALEGTKTVWLEGDQVSVTVGGSVIGTLDFVGEDLFKGDVEAGHDGTATLNYPAGVTSVPTTQKAVAGTFADEAALLEGTISMDDLRAGNSAVLANKTALLQFSVAQAGDVTFEVGSTKYTVTGCETGATYYACVAPETGKLSYTLGGKIGANEKADFSPVANTIYSLGELTIKTTEIGIVGSFQKGTTWDVNNPVAMDCLADGWVFAENVELYKDDEFKFVTGNSWDNPNYGAKEALFEASVDEDYTLVKDGQNIKATKNGKFNLYFNPTTLAFKYTCVEEYTDLMVVITIDNKADWSPLNITLKDGDTFVADNVGVTGNKYSISGDYIGKTLTCTLSSGDKKSDAMNITVTKNGATVTLEETIIKLKVQLNTDNAKQWWGNTMKIHVWNTATAFDTSWPGNTMTSEGNYTWSIIVPSELVGKKINFLVHNGNGWQSSDSTVTIKAEGNTVTGSSIGLN